MPRTVTHPRDPEAVALAALALRGYGSGGKSRSEFEKGINQELAKHGVKPKIAQAFSDRFYGVRPTTRRQLFGELGEPDARPPSVKDLARVPNRVKTWAGLTLPTGLRLAAARVVDPARLFDVFLDPDREPPRPTYTVRYKGLYCGDRTDDRWVTSDEIYAVTSAVHIRRADGENVIRTERHPKSAEDTWNGDVDTFEARVGPVAGVWFGDSDVMSLTTVVFEHDEGDPDYYKEEVENLVILALAVAAYFFPAASPLFALVALKGWLTDSAVPER